jgi:hypothetical protein
MKEKIALAIASQDRLEDWNRLHMATLDTLFPVGSGLHYLRHGKTPQPATVCQHGPRFSPPWRVRVRNLRTQKLIWITLYDIKRAEEVMP